MRVKPKAAELSWAYTEALTKPSHDLEDAALAVSTDICSYPMKLESVILKHYGISTIAVVGLPDARLTEMVIARIQLNHNWTWVDSSSDHSTIQKEQCLSKETLRQHCRTNNLSRSNGSI
ncbi:2-succinylbenzoate--CoA ligase, chloroplastic/peroxisomal-like protein [Tanacetum coccineum]